MPEDSFLYMIDSMAKTCKWFALQALLFFLMPYVWDYEYSGSTLLLMFVYTMLYAVYWNFVPMGKRVRLLYLPYVAYIIIGVVVYCATNDWCAPLWQVILQPVYGATCFIGVRLFQKGVHKLRKRFRLGSLVAYTVLILCFILLKVSSVASMRAEAMENERADIMALQKYAHLHQGQYRPTVEQWVRRAQREWTDKDTGVLVSFLQEDGSQFVGSPVKGSYSALNCYYLTFIDE